MQKINAENALPDIPEHYLHALFQDHTLHTSPLRTLDGRLLRIREPGLRNPDNGPDFLDALLQVGDTVLRGDVEIHLRWQDWYRHGHDEDRRYRRVVLHALWQRPERLPEALKKRFAHLLLPAMLRIPVSKWLSGVQSNDSTLLSRPSLPAAPQLGAMKLKELAWRRFLRKTEEIRGWVEAYGWENALHMGLGRALGYHKNSIPFTELVRCLPPDKILAAVHPLQRSPLLFWILLAWHGGLLDRPLPPAAGQYQKTVEEVRRQFSARFSPPGQNLLQWHFSRLRPQNNPYLRLAGYAQLLFEYQHRPLFDGLLAELARRRTVPETLTNLEKILCIPLSDVFSGFLGGLLGMRGMPKTAVGRQRARQFILNVLLPIAYHRARRQGSAGFQLFLEDFYFRFPAVDQNAILRRLMPQPSGAAEKYGYARQGLLEFYRLQTAP